MIGAFHQPSLVLADTDSLATLPDREMRAGYAEVIKYGLLGDAEFFAWLEANGRSVLARKAGPLEYAMEAETGFSDRLLHGEAVALGMVLAARYSALRGELSPGNAQLVAQTISGSGMTANINELGLDCTGQELARHMRHDKKMEGSGTLPFLLLKGLGEAYMARDVELSDVAAFLDSELA
jgi:3-dehydroquinate synthase